MSGPTHASFAFTIYLAVSSIMTLYQPEHSMFLLLGALFPDIDHHGSMVGKRIFLIRRFLTHRKQTHSIPVALLLLVVGLISFPQHWTFVLAFFIGVVSHILLDLFNLSGVYLFWPFLNKRISFRSNRGKAYRKRESFIDRTLLLGFAILSGLMLFYEYKQSFL